MTETSSTNVSSPSAELRQLIKEVVRPGFRRCCEAEPEFFDDFYFNLSDRLPIVGSMFAQVDMEQQNQLIRDGIADLIDYAIGSSRAAAELKRLADSHSRSGLGIAPEFYPHWVDSLMETIRKHDPEADDVSEAVWRQVLADGITLMISGY